MNFLGHYYMDKEKSDPYFTFGALLPDLVRGFSKIYNKIDPTLVSQNELHQSILHGIERHMQVDHAFHNLNSFHQLCSEITLILKSNPNLHLPKSFFVAHILVELLIDKQIVNNDLNIAITFYNQLKILNKNELISFCNSIHFFEFKSIFLSKFDTFIQNEYAIKLMHNENVYIALERICFSRINFKPNESEKIAINDMILQADNLLKENYSNILKQTLEKLKYD